MDLTLAPVICWRYVVIESKDWLFIIGWYPLHLLFYPKISSSISFLIFYLIFIYFLTWMIARVCFLRLCWKKETKLNFLFCFVDIGQCRIKLGALTPCSFGFLLMLLYQLVWAAGVGGSWCCSRCWWGIWSKDWLLRPSPEGFCGGVWTWLHYQAQ